MKKTLLIGAALVAFLFSGCVSGSGNVSRGATKDSAVTGGAAGANSTGNTAVEKCSAPLGTVAFYEDQRTDWYSYLTRNYKLTSTLPVLRLLAQQTNCFVIVERGKMMDNMMQERALAASGETRKVQKGRKGFGKGQMVSADYTISPEIFFSDENVGGAGGRVGAAIGGWAGVIGAIAGGINKKETQTTLILVDNRSGVQIAAATGHATATDFFGMGGAGGSRALGGLGGYSRTPEGKTLVNAFLDSMNNLVISLKSYKAQSVQGGLGQGGTLEIAD